MKLWTCSTIDGDRETWTIFFERFIDRKERFGDLLDSWRNAR